MPQNLRVWNHNTKIFKLLAFSVLKKNEIFSFLQNPSWTTTYQLKLKKFHDEKKSSTEVHCILIRWFKILLSYVNTWNTVHSIGNSVARCLNLVPKVFSVPRECTFSR